MKVGDQLVVMMEGFEVALASIESIEGSEVAIRIPETRVVMGVKHSLTDIPPERGNTEQVLLGTEEKDYEDSADPSTQRPVEKPETTVVSGGIKPEDISDTGLRGAALDSSAID